MASDTERPEQRKASARPSGAETRPASAVAGESADARACDIEQQMTDNSVMGYMPGSVLGPRDPRIPADVENSG